MEKNGPVSLLDFQNLEIDDSLGGGQDRENGERPLRISNIQNQVVVLIGWGGDSWVPTGYWRVLVKFGGKLPVWSRVFMPGWK